MLDEVRKALGGTVVGIRDIMKTRTGFFSCFHNVSMVEISTKGNQHVHQIIGKIGLVIS